MDAKLGTLLIRERKILARGRYQKAPGALKKVQRQIKTLKKGDR